MRIRDTRRFTGDARFDSTNGTTTIVLTSNPIAGKKVSLAVPENLAFRKVFFIGSSQTNLGSSVDSEWQFRLRGDLVIRLPVTYVNDSGFRLPSYYLPTYNEQFFGPEVYTMSEGVFSNHFPCWNMTVRCDEICYWINRGVLNAAGSVSYTMGLACLSQGVR